MILDRSQPDLLIMLYKNGFILGYKIYILIVRVRDYVKDNNGRYNNPWDVKLNYRRGPSHIEKRAGMPKERWKWAFASV